MFEVTDDWVIDTYPTAAPPTKPLKAFNMLFWLLQFFAAVTLLTVGASKLSQMRAVTFENLGFAEWLSYCAGSVQVVGAILIIVPRTAQLGAAVLALTMVGAIAMHPLNIGSSPVPALALLGITGAVAWYRSLA
jgi:putative oxidoreductase